MARAFVRASSQYLQCTGTPVTVWPMTFSAWVKHSSTTAVQTIVGVFNSASIGDAYTIQLNTSTVYSAQNVTTAGQNGAVTPAVSPSTTLWCHVAGKFEDPTAIDRTVWYQGGNKGTSTTARLPTGINVCAIGRRTDSSTPQDYFDGLIAEVTIWSVGLTDNEVLTLANRAHSLTVRPASIVGYWPLYGVGSPEPDLSGGARNMTVTGATASADHPPIAPFPPADTIWIPQTAVAAGVVYTQTNSGTLTLAGTLTKAPTKFPRGTLTAAAVLAKATAHFKRGTLTPAGVLAKATSKFPTGTLTSAGALASVTVTQYAQSLAGTLASAGALAKAVAHFKAGGLTSAGTVAKASSHFKGGTLGLAGAVSNSYVPGAAGYTQNLAGVLATSAVLTKNPTKFPSGTLTMAATLNNVESGAVPSRARTLTLTGVGA